MLIRVLAILVVLGGEVFSQQPPSAPIDSQQERTATEQPAKPDQRGTDQMPLSIRVLPSPDAEEKAKQEERERHEKATIDKKLTYETQRIADYTYWLSIFTLALFVAAGGQIMLFWYQLRFIRDSLADTRKAADAAKETARATRKSVVLASDNAERQLRAYVSINKAQISADTPEIILGFTNTGQTPAKNAAIRAQTYLAPPPFVGVFSMDEVKAGPFGVLWRNIPLSTRVLDTRLNQQLRDDLKNKARALFVYGDIRYEDAFGKERTTKFRLMTGGEHGMPNADLVFTEEGNDYE